MKNNKFHVIYDWNSVANDFHRKNNEKHKVEKTKKYIRNSKNNKIHKKLIVIPNFFSSTIDRNAIKNIHTKN